MLCITTEEVIERITVAVKGLIINSEAVERLLEKVSFFSSQGRWEKAEDIIDKLIIAKPWDKTLLLRKSYLIKAKWISTGSSDSVLLDEAIHLFSRCHLLTGSVDAGINSATLLLLSGRQKEAYRRADDTARHCRQLILESDIQQHETYAMTIAEVNLLRSRFEAAESWYKAALLKNSSASEQVIENMNLLLDFLKPEPELASRIRMALEV